uniref:Uncharacterized protein n=1 Tax=Arundo donax TaxID=35708 RepID=A0A0A9HI04_ARUDO
MLFDHRISIAMDLNKPRTPFSLFSLSCKVHCYIHAPIRFLVLNKLDFTACS